MTELDDFIAAAQRRALHLEMRDTYPKSEEFLAWRAGEPLKPNPFPDWREVQTQLVSRGVDMRRLRVFSEPMAEYIQWEWEDAIEVHIVGGERLRWLPRQLASDLKFPGNDFWLVDDALLFLTFQGDGESLGYERREEPDLVDFCLASFEAAWSRGTEHSDYTPTFCSP